MTRRLAAIVGVVLAIALPPSVDETLWRTQIKNNLSIVAGRHTFKVGGEWLHTVNDQVFRGFFEGRYLSWVRQMVCGGQADRIAGIARSIPSRSTHVS
jgi:hypothetical protein